MTATQRATAEKIDVQMKLDRGFITMVLGALLVSVGVLLYQDYRLVLILVGVVLYLIGADNYLVRKLKEDARRK